MTDHNEPDHFPDARKMVDLAARIERAEGPDRALFEDICIATQYGGPNSVGAKDVRPDPGDDGWLIFEIGDDDCCNKVPDFTRARDCMLLIAHLLRARSAS